MPDALSVGGGAARGVKAFLASFQQARMYEQQEKLQKNAVLIEFLAKQLEDPHLKYKDRANIMRSIPGLVGAKSEAFEPLMRLLDASNQEDVEVAPRQAGTPAQKGGIIEGESIEGIKGGPNEVSKFTDDYGDVITVKGMESLSTTGSAATSLQQKDTQATNDVPALMEKKGELTPAKLQSLLVLAQNKATDSADIEKQTKLLTLQYNLQKDILGKGGYTVPLPHTFDQDKNLIVRFMRAADGDVLSKNLGKVTTEALLRAGIMANQPKGKFGALQMAHQIVSAYETDPTTYPDWQYKAAKSLLDEVEKTGQVKDAQIKSLTQNITGVPPKPITPAQDRDDVARDTQNRLAIQKDLDDAQAEANAAKARMNALDKKDPKTGLSRKDLATNEVVSAEKAFYNTEYTVNDPEYAKQRTDAEQARIRFNEIEKEYNQAAGAEVLAKGKLQGAQGRLKGLGSGGYESNPRLKPIIDKFRELNKDSPLYSTWTPQQIIDYLRQKQLLK